MEQQFPEEKVLLHMLSQAPAGLTLNDIKNKITLDCLGTLNW
jgi:hypothetical protein